MSEDIASNVELMPIVIGVVVSIILVNWDSYWWSYFRFFN